MFASKGDSRLPIPLRRIRIRRDKGGIITLITNDLKRTAVEIATLYKVRWQIELLFRWIKQHLDIRKFLGTNDNAIRLQILAAMIAYLLLRIAARVNCLIPAADIAKPPPINPSQRQPKCSPDQLGFCYG
jgi:putative transposase